MAKEQVPINKPDSDPILYDGTGTPYLAMFDGGHQPILDPVSKLPIGIYTISFEYTYQEGKEDSGRFIILTNNPDLISIEQFGYLMPLYLQWGWIYPDSTSKSGPLKKVVIVGHDVHFTPEGTRITIEFADCSILLKNMPPNFEGQAKGFEQYVTSVMLGNPTGITFIDHKVTGEIKERVVVQRVVKSGDVVGNQSNGLDVSVPYKDFGNGPGQTIYPYRRNQFVEQVYYLTQEPYRQDADQVGVKILEATPENVELTKQLPNDYKLIDLNQRKATNIMLIGTPKNKYQQINQLANRLKNGPYHINGSGENIVVENQNFDKPISKVYTYAGGNGELLEFTIKSKFTKSSVNIAKASDIDPDTKEAKTTTTQVNSDEGNSYSIDGYMHWSQSWGPNPLNDPTGFGVRYPISTLPNNRRSNAPLVLKNAGDLTPQEVEQLRRKNLEDNIVPIADDPKPLGPFSSKDDARAIVSANVTLTKEEFKEFFESLKAEYEIKTKNCKSKEEIAQAVAYMNTLNNYTVKRKVTIIERVNPIDFDPNRDSEAKPGEPSYGYNQIRNNGPGYPSYREPYEQWNEGLHYLLTKGGYSRQIGETIIMNRNLPHKNEVFLEKEVELEIPVNGTRTLASDLTPYSDIFMGNDIEEIIRNQLTATAILVGDPALQKSQNLEIRNVSEKYSGTWYIKKVTHQFDTGSGYLCNAEFIKKNIVVSKNVIKASMSMLNAMANVNKVAKNVYMSVGHDKTSEIVELLEEYGKTHPGYSIIGVHNQATNQIDIYFSKQDFKIMTPNSSIKVDIKTLQQQGKLEYKGSIDTEN